MKEALFQLEESLLSKVEEGVSHSIKSVVEAAPEHRQVKKGA